MFANVALPLASYQAFTYRIPPEMQAQVRIGLFVHVPFRNRSSIGVIVDISENTDYDGVIKSITSIRDDMTALPDDLWATLDWMSRYYITPLGMVLKAALPLGFAEKHSHRQWKMVIITPEGRDALPKWTGNAPVQMAILEYLDHQPSPVPVAELAEFASSAPAACKRLEERGWVTISSQDADADPFNAMLPQIDRQITLTKEQNAIVDELESARLSGEFSPFVLHGVTGSGKTEVYLAAARKVVQAGQAVLILVPEIALTPPVAARFRAAFGVQVALWHSHLSKAEKAWTWQQLITGKCNIVIGARSALFAPLQNIGLIVVDEEQESSYKQEDPAPRYHARDAALVRGKHAKAVVLLTSATPSVESYYNGISGRFKKLDLSQRFGGATYPNVRLVDLNAERQRTGVYRFILSEPLIAAVQDRLDKHEQVIILQNRRGFAPVSICNDCGYTYECPNCAVLLTYHKGRARLICHYCNHTTAIPEACNECGSPHIFLQGVGTEMVEQELTRLFPTAVVARLDADTSRKRGALGQILYRFGEREVDILLGTQMIAKGLDFKNVTLVGVINADTGLAIPDYRAGERTFQLVYQVCGRAGRSKDKPGEAIIQTNHPDDIAIKAAAHLDAHRFYNQILAERQGLLYPPFARLMRILVYGRDHDQVWTRANELGRMLRPLPKGLQLLGPASAPYERLRNQWRVHLLIKSDRALDPSGSQLHHFVGGRISMDLLFGRSKGVRIKIDVDPVALL